MMIIFFYLLQASKLQVGTQNELCWTGMSGGSSGNLKATDQYVIVHVALFVY